jgi:hypothetical protein
MIAELRAYSGYHIDADELRSPIIVTMRPDEGSRTGIVAIEERIGTLTGEAIPRL